MFHFMEWARAVIVMEWGKPNNGVTSYVTSLNFLKGQKLLKMLTHNCSCKAMFSNYNILKA